MRSCRTLIHVKYYYNDKTKDDKMGDQYGTHGREQDSYRILVRNPKGKITLKRYRSGWEINFKMDFTETEKIDVYCIIWVKTGATSGLL
jgi:hypothetical protein